MGNAHPLSLSENLAAVRRRIEQAAAAADRAPESITLVAVSKRQSVAAIREAYALGLRDFGENYVQEWLEKREALRDLSDIRWHLIGPLQRNKAKFIDASCHCIHTVETVAGAEALARAREKAAIAQPLRVLVQLEIDPDDANKHGVPAAHAQPVCEAVAALPALQWDGFMGMGPWDATNEHLHGLYLRFAESARSLWQRLAREGEPVLSLGMSDDLEIAVACGSTLVRVGTDLFGARLPVAKS